MNCLKCPKFDKTKRACTTDTSGEVENDCYIKLIYGAMRCLMEQNNKLISIFSGMYETQKSAVKIIKNDLDKGDEWRNK